MAVLDILYKLTNIIFPFADFLYVLQLEEYFNFNYLYTIRRFFFRRNIQKRDTLKWTSRIQTTLIVALEFYTFTLALGILTQSLLLSFVVASILVPFYIFLANIILTPLYNLLKARVCTRAASFMKANSKAKVIGIAGSYGKTTTKNLVYEFIRFNYKTQMVPGNLNTPIGIAVWLLKNFDPSTEYLIVEMDAFVPGAIKKICTITPPDIAVLTNIGDQHMTRFRSKKALEIASYEVFEYSQPNAIHISQKDIQRKRIYKQYSISVNECIALAKLVAEKLAIPQEFVEDSVKKFELPDRRQKLTMMNGFEVVDDSYNISLSTAKAGIDAAYELAKLKRKKLITIAGGIPEAQHVDKANQELGKYLSEKADFVLVLRTIFSKQITSQLKDNFTLKHNLTDSWHYIENHYQPDEVIILLQPELTDLYYLQ
jgi:UDP-N-acetylmuramyl pentapeptide synthase